MLFKMPILEMLLVLECVTLPWASLSIFIGCLFHSFFLLFLYCPVTSKMNIFEAVKIELLTGQRKTSYACNGEHDPIQWRECMSLLKESNDDWLCCYKDTPLESKLLVESDSVFHSDGTFVNVCSTCEMGLVADDVERGDGLCEQCNGTSYEGETVMLEERDVTDTSEDDGEPIGRSYKVKFIVIHVGDFEFAGHHYRICFDTRTNKQYSFIRVDKDGIEEQVHKGKRAITRHIGCDSSATRLKFVALDYVLKEGEDELEWVEKNKI